MPELVRIGILGCAAVAEYALIAPAREDTGIIVEAVASRDLRRARDYAQRNGISRVYTYDELLRTPDIDAIYIALPNSLHCEWTIRALEAGKAVLCEKPLAANAREAELMQAAAERTKQKLVEAFHWRYHPLAQRLQEIVHSAVLGRIEAVDVRFMIPKRYVPDGDIRLQYGLAGGSTMDVGCYCINLLRFLLGEPLNITAAIPTLYSDTIDAGMYAEMEFNGSIGRFHCTHFYENDGIEMDATIMGTRGRLEARNQFVPQWGNSLEIHADGKSTHETATNISSYHFQAKEFARVIRENMAIKTPVNDSILNMRVIDQVYRRAGMRLRGKEH